MIKLNNDPKSFLKDYVELRCDGCGERITDLGDANAVFKYAEDGKTEVMAGIYCKKNCVRMAHAYPHNSIWELHQLAAYLGMAIKTRHKQAMGQIDMLSRMA